MTGDTTGLEDVPDGDAGLSPQPAERLQALMKHIEGTDALDEMAARLSSWLPDWVLAGRGREILSGKWLGHSLHPLLTDFPLGCWASASLLDLLGLGRHRDAARRLVGLGLLASLPTAAAGLSDWSRLATPDRRVGLVHAQLNTLVLALYGASYVQRRRHRSGHGIALGILGGVAATASGYLGGHLTTTRAVTRDNRLLDAPVAGT
jgi:uncharacterized membrane protein